MGFEKTDGSASRPIKAEAHWTEIFCSRAQNSGSVGFKYVAQNPQPREQRCARLSLNELDFPRKGSIHGPALNARAPWVNPGLSGVMAPD
jgi:hypothetical protein